jgi:hypothetical protein
VDRDEFSGFELRNCSITVDDTRGEGYRQLRNDFVPHFARYPKQTVPEESADPPVAP